MKAKIAYLPGDGIGPEVAGAAKKVLEAIAEKFGHEFVFQEALIGAAAIDETGSALPEKTLGVCQQSDAILFGAVGLPKYDNDPSAKVRPEQGILGLRQAMNLYANLRPVITFPTTPKFSPLKPEIVAGTDLIVVRELIAGIYFGKRGRSDDGSYAFDTAEYTREQVEQILRSGFDIARKRRKKLTVVDKANVIETSRLWREIAQKMEAEYPDISVDYMFVDNASMKLITQPTDFDVIVTDNMFGDILSDESSVITGSLGMLPSASIGGKVGLYEPIHGSYPQAAGKNIANPIGSILSAALLLLYSFDLQTEHDAIFMAVQKVLEEGCGTEDIVKDNPLSTEALTRKMIDKIII